MFGSCFRKLAVIVVQFNKKKNPAIIPEGAILLWSWQARKIMIT